MRNLLSLLTLLSPSSVLQHAAREIDRHSIGCGNEHNFAGETKTFYLESGGREREYLVYLPANYKKDDARPLIVAYHGAGGSPEQIEDMSGFSDDSINPDMITVYPRGIKKSWQGPSYAQPGVDDEEFTTELVNHVESKYCIDKTRVYAAGFSNGGGFVGTLACSADHGRQFAAFAAVEGSFYTDASAKSKCEPARVPLPILEIHSSEDPVIPYEGGEGRGGPLPAIPDWLDWWAKRNDCGSNKTTKVGESTDHLTWDCGGLESSLQHYKTSAPGHYWQDDEMDIDVSSVILKFLSSHARP